MLGTMASPQTAQPHRLKVHTEQPPGAEPRFRVGVGRTSRQWHRIDRLFYLFIFYSQSTLACNLDN